MTLCKGEGGIWAHPHTWEFEEGSGGDESKAGVVRGLSLLCFVHLLSRTKNDY